MRGFYFCLLIFRIFARILQKKQCFLFSARILQEKKQCFLFFSNFRALIAYKMILIVIIVMYFFVQVLSGSSIDIASIGGEGGGIFLA